VERVEVKIEDVARVVVEDGGCDGERAFVFEGDDCEGAAAALLGV
jgi:hypothetical protein